MTQPRHLAEIRHTDLVFPDQSNHQGSYFGGAAMAEMDTDRSGVVELPEFERWWRLNGGDLEEHRANALTFVCEGGLEVLAVCPTRVSKQRWLAGCKSLGWLLA